MLSYSLRGTRIETARRLKRTMITKKHKKRLLKSSLFCCLLEEMRNIHINICVDPFHPYSQLDFIGFAELSSMRSLNKYSVGGSQGLFVLFSCSTRKWSYQIMCGEIKLYRKSDIFWQKKRPRLQSRALGRARFSHHRGAQAMLCLPP